MNQCTMFEKCNAPLCPLDPGVKARIWWADEEICRSRKYGQHRWIRKQRSIQKNQTQNWLDKPVTYQMLFDASRPMALTDEQRAAKRAALVKRNQSIMGFVTL